jgi:hypothetical protein
MLIEISTATMFDDETSVEGAGTPARPAAAVPGQLPHLAGVVSSPAAERGRALRILPACVVTGAAARSSEQHQHPAGSQALAPAFTSAAERARSNIDALVTIIDGADGVFVNSATDELDAAETLARHQDGEGELRPDLWPFLTAVHALRQIERAVVTAATNLGGRDGLPATAPAAS